MIGNQPSMKAPAKVDGNKIAFTFVKATNLKSDKDLYMHDATFTNDRFAGRIFHW
jgi:hypothetical protein